MSAQRREHVAVDLGASSGRVVMGHIDSRTLRVREVHRFRTGPMENGAAPRWNVSRLWADICEGLRAVREPVVSIGVDAWGVDYALLGDHGELLQDPYCYRNPRTISAMREVLRMVSRDEIYEQTGVQFISINTLYQLHAAQVDTPDLLRAARRLLMIPDLFHYWLTGNAVSEYTAASTTQFCNPRIRNWAHSLMKRLDLPAHLLAEIVEPGTLLGQVSPSAAGGLMSGTQVIAPASHDTGSAVAAVYARADTAFLSSGTWSLLGIETTAPVISADAMRLNFTNEGGAFRTNRLLKNVMGLWMLQACCSQWTAEGSDVGFDDLVEQAREAPRLKSLVDPDHPTLLNPRSMVSAIAELCRQTDQAPPSSFSAVTRTILESLAMKYRLVLRDLELVTGRSIRRIRIIGGGSKNSLLNQLTADATGKEVLAGPVEATALGNLGVQMVACGEMGSLEEFRATVERSFPCQVFTPRETESWEREEERFQQYRELSLERSHA